jgi:hypothetical protein
MAKNHTTAYNAIKSVVEKVRGMSGVKMLNKAKAKANNNKKGSGNKNVMNKAAAKYLANHPGSKKAQNVVKAM